jgi:hypothetical protein
MDTLNEPGETFQPNMHLVAHHVGLDAIIELYQNQQKCG